MQCILVERGGNRRDREEESGDRSQVSELTGWRGEFVRVLSVPNNKQ